VVQWAFGQSADSSFVVQKAYPKYGTYHDIEQGMNNLKTIDTALYQVQNFDPGYLHNLGTPGTPAFNLVWDPFKSPGFDLGFHQWDIYKITDKNMLFYNTQNPYADFSYVQGDKDMQAFKGTWTQNIKPYFNYSIHFNLLNTNSGYYDPQQTSVNSFDVNSWYQSPDNRYMAMISFVFNKFAADENGGISPKNLPFTGQTDLPVNLGPTIKPTSAKQSYFENFYTIRQYLRTGPVQVLKVRDTDSVASHLMKPEYFISHSFEYHTTKYQYTDAAANTFPFAHSFMDTNQTNGTYVSNEFTNKISAGRAVFNHPVKIDKKVDSSSVNSNSLFYDVFLKYSYIAASQNSGELNDQEFYDNTSVGFELSNYKKAGYSLYGEYFLEGYNRHDYLLNAHFNIPFIKNFLPKFNVDLKAQQAAPAYTDQLFYGNHFLWGNSFQKTRTEEASAYFSDSLGFRVGASFITESNLIYYDTLALPYQDPGTVSYVNAFIVKDIRIGRHFHFLNNINFQKPINSGYDVRVPEWLIRTSYFYDHYLFKKAVLLQGGFDFSYSSPYYGYRYMPEISKFYVQDQTKIGNYQVWDVWVAAKIKRLTAFLKFEHVNEKFSGNWYFTAPYYPMTPTVLRYGIRWSFYN